MTVPPDGLRLLLDQGFPKPPGFDPSAVDRNLQWVHLWDWRPELSEYSTPDWVLYCEAADAGFNALVTRDFTQAEQAEEMVCLSRLKGFHVVSWRHRMDDPISEWGQLLAYLPLLRRFIGNHDSRVIFLPATRLAHGSNVHQPQEFIGEIARSREESVDQVRRQALAAMADWEVAVHGLAGRYTASLQGPRR